MIDDSEKLRALIRDADGHIDAGPVSYTTLLGLAVASLRHQKGMTQTQLSRASGISQSTISRIELGEADMTAPQLDALATALGTRPSTIFDAADAARTALNEEDIAVPRKAGKDAKHLVPGGGFAAGTAIAAGAMFGPIGLLAGSIIGVLMSRRNDNN
jgi:transcriptional regulator with XRE-family HTH domain